MCSFFGATKLLQQWLLTLSYARILWHSSSVYTPGCRQTRDQDERRHLLPSHRGGVLWPFKECTQSESVYMRVFVYPWHFTTWHCIVLTPVCPFFLLPLSFTLYYLTFFSKMTFTYTHKEPQPLADLQCEDPRSGVLHGGSVPWSHAYLDGCYCNRCWRTHALHGLTELQLLFARLPKKI